MGKPVGVQIHRADGTVLNCELVNEGIDDEGMDCWVIANAVYQHGDHVTVEQLPAMTGIGFRARGIRDKTLEVEWEDEP